MNPVTTTEPIFVEVRASRGVFISVEATMRDDGQTISLPEPVWVIGPARQDGRVEIVPVPALSVEIVREPGLVVLHGMRYASPKIEPVACGGGCSGAKIIEAGGNGQRPSA